MQKYFRILKPIQSSGIDHTGTDNYCAKPPMDLYAIFKSRTKSLDFWYSNKLKLVPMKFYRNLFSPTLYSQFYPGCMSLLYAYSLVCVTSKHHFRRLSEASAWRHNSSAQLHPTVQTPLPLRNHGLHHRNCEKERYQDKKSTVKRGKIKKGQRNKRKPSLTTDQSLQYCHALFWGAMESNSSKKVRHGAAAAALENKSRT